ncbi:MAG: hypothetical protein FK734_16095 [Asgard group archaeon]|nr:hypothetical protein [Asgard group archaeon]
MKKKYKQLCILIEGMHEDVARSMDIDFIYFDLMLTAIWITLLLVRKRFKAFFFGLFGYGVVQFTDSVIWYEIKETRHINIENDLIGPHLFLTYFSFTYGMIMFSYAPIMFDKTITKLEKALWSALIYGGWLTIALMSQFIPWNDQYIEIWRDMGTSRLGQILMAVIGYLVLIILNLILKYTNWKFIEPIPWWYFAYLFAVGIFIHFSMESTLMIAGIRPLYWDVLAVNSLLEFNTGIPILFIMWILVSRKDYVKKEPQTVDLSVTDTSNDAIIINK